MTHASRQRDTLDIGPYACTARPWRPQCRTGDSHCKTASRARTEEVVADADLISTDSNTWQCVVLRRRANSATGTRTRVARVRAEYPNQLDYSGVRIKPPGKCHAAYQAIVDYQLHGVRYRAAALRRAPSPLHARRPNPEPHEHGTCGQHVPVSRRPASLHAPRHRRGALLPPRRRSTQYTPRPPPCRSCCEACTLDGGRGAQPWARTAHTCVADALVPDSRRTWRVACARAPWRACGTPRHRDRCL